MNHRKIAELANVSASTVSKALSGSSEISRETAENIRRIAIEAGYFKEKNKRKREYTNNNSLLISVIVPEIQGHHYATIVTCIKNEVEARGGHFAIYMYDFDKNKCGKILQSIILRGATDGVIMFSPPDLPIKPNIPIVCFSGFAVPDYDSIGFSMENVMEDSIKFLSGLGHKKIGFVGENNTADAAKAFEVYMKENGLLFRDDFVYIIKERFEAIGTKAAKEILSQTDRPTAIIAAYDEVAMALIYELTQNGLKVPDDISVMGRNNIPSASYAHIPLTTVETFSADQYRTAVETLFDKILNETKSIKHITIQHKIIPRATTKDIGVKTT